MQEKPIHVEETDPDSCAQDQKKRGYYYDDSHGYEEFDPDAEEACEEEGGTRGRGAAEHK